ncbi:MAG: hypothetical protein ACNA78_10780, partial [Balneolaceae bacterium]
MYLSRVIRHTFYAALFLMLSSPLHTLSAQQFTPTLQEGAITVTFADTATAEYSRSVITAHNFTITDEQFSPVRFFQTWTHGDDALHRIRSHPSVSDVRVSEFLGSENVTFADDISDEEKEKHLERLRGMPPTIHLLFTMDVTRSDAIALLQSWGLEFEDRHVSHLPRQASVAVPVGSEPEAMQLLEAHPAVMFAARVAVPEIEFQATH